MTTTTTTTTETPTVALTDDNVDDILYLGRADEVADLTSTVAEIATGQGVSPHAVLVGAVDSASGNTVAHYAAANGHRDVLEYVIGTFSSSSQTPESTPSTDPPSLSSLSLQEQERQRQQERQPELVKFLNTKNKAGNTALHWASVNGHVGVVSVLLAAGADPTILNEAGHDAVYEAELADKNEVVDVLLKDGIGLDSAIAGLGRDGTDGGDDDDGESDDGEEETGKEKEEKSES